MGSALPARQAEALRLVRAFYDTHGVPPSVRVLAEQMGLRSSSTVYQHLMALERKGYLHAVQRGTGRSRYGTVYVPVKERVA